MLFSFTAETNPAMAPDKFHGLISQLVNSSVLDGLEQQTLPSSVDLLLLIK